MKSKELKANRKPKANRLGNSALVFSLSIVPIVGLILGIIAACVGPKKNDSMLTKDGIKAIIMSVIVTVVLILLICVVIMVGIAAPFIVMSLG